MQRTLMTKAILAAAIGAFAAVGAGAQDWSPQGDNLYFLKKVGIGKKRPGYPLHVQSRGEKTVFVFNKQGQGDAYGVYARANSDDGVGVYGECAGGMGVHGLSTDYIGVMGEAVDGDAVYGLSENGIGVRGYTDNGDGVSGQSQLGCGVSGSSVSGDGVYGIGETSGVNGVGVRGGCGVRGFAGIGQDAGYAVYAEGDLLCDGDAYKPGGGSWTATSDVRLKKNIAGLDGALDTLLSLRGVTFEYKDPDAIGELPGQRMGFIAQEVEEVMPDWVGEHKEGYKTVTVRGFEALTVEALREMKASHESEVAELKTENNELKAANEDLEARLTQLEAMVAQLAAKASN